MSTFEDIETQNCRRFWSSFERVRVAGTVGRATRAVLRKMEFVPGVEADPLAVVYLPPTRSPRTALHLLGPWAPKLGPIRVEFHDGRVGHMNEIASALVHGVNITTTGERGVARFRWTQEVES